MSFENLLIALMLWLSAKRSNHGFTWHPSVSMMRLLLKQASPLFVVALLANLFGRVDQIMLGTINGYENLGSYAVAWKIIEALGMFPYFAVTALAPVLSGLQRESQALFENRYMLATRILFWFSVMVCFALSFVLPDLLLWAFGDQYAAAISPMNILLWTLPMMILGHMSFQWILHMGGMEYIIGQGVFMLLTAAILCWLMITNWGSVGAAIAILLAQLLTNMLYPVLSSTGRRIGLIQLKSVLSPR